VLDGIAEDLPDPVDLLHELKRLPLAGRKNDPVGPGIDGIGDDLEGGGEGAADLAGLEPDFETCGIGHPVDLIREEKREGVGDLFLCNHEC